MPVIRIEVPEGTSTDTKRRIREGTKQAVLDTQAQKETKYDYVAVSEVFGEIGDGVPLITVDLRPGREAERKKALVDREFASCRKTPPLVLSLIHISEPTRPY